MFIQSLRMTARDWRAGELRFLLVALIVAVSALSSVGFFIDRMRAGLNRDAHQLLGADLLVNADDPIQQRWKDEAKRRGLLVAETAAFQSMAQAGEGEASMAQLSAVKAVSNGYPLRGQLSISTDPDDASRAIGQKTRDTPAPGTVWVDANLLPALRTGVGGSIQLGDKQFRIAQLIATEPDKGAGFSNFAPRVMLSLQDLPATGLVDAFSRVTYRLQVASTSKNDMSGVAAFEKWLRADIATRNVRGVRIETLENGRPEMRATLDRMKRDWDLRQTWGWDYPMMAMTAARLGAPQEAVDWLFFDARNNQFGRSGMTPRVHLDAHAAHFVPTATGAGAQAGAGPDGPGYQRAAETYYPSNGGLLLAVALMAGGWDGQAGNAPGFPKTGWKVKVEGILPSL